VDVGLLAGPEWRERERFTLGFALAVYGALAAFVIIAATYWAILRERMFADHALYLLSLLVFMAATPGCCYVAFPDGLLARRGILAQWAFATAAIGFAVGFGTRFLDVARTVRGSPACWTACASHSSAPHCSRAVSPVALPLVRQP
jgi:hypothetical protein